MEHQSTLTRSTAQPAKRAPRPTRPRQLPDIKNLPPVVRVADLWTNRPGNKFGLTPYSRKTIEGLVKSGRLQVIRLGPRCTCTTKENVLALVAGEL